MTQFSRGIFGAVAILSLTGLHAANAQTTYGNNGLFVHPTATNNSVHHISLNVSYLNILSSSTNKEAHWVPVNITVPAGDRAQWGATYLTQITNRQSFGSAGLFGKYELLSETNSRPAVATAASFLGGHIKLTSVSLVASKSFKQNGHNIATLHVGGQYVHWHDDDSSSGDERAFIGTNVPITKRFDFIGELGSKLKFDNAGTSSLGVLYHDSSHMSVGTGYVNNGRSKRGGFFFGIGRPIGGD